MGVRRCKPKRVPGELGGSDGRPSRDGESRRLHEVGGDPGVRALCGEPEVAGAVERICDDLGEASVYAPSLARRRAVVDHRREQWVREANRSVRALDHARGKGAIERTLGDVQACKELNGWTARGRHDQQRLSRRRRQLVEACPDQSLQRFRNTKRLRRVDVRAKSPGELEHIEGVPTGRLVHA